MSDTNPTTMDRLDVVRDLLATMTRFLGKIATEVGRLVDTVYGFIQASFGAIVQGAAGSPPFSWVFLGALFVVTLLFMGVSQRVADTVLGVAPAEDLARRTYMVSIFGWLLLLWLTVGLVAKKPAPRAEP